MDKALNQVIMGLHPLERKVVPHLKNNLTGKDIAKASKLSEVEAIRALQWLSNKKALTLESKEIVTLALDKNGLTYVSKGLPEKRFLQALDKKQMTVEALAKETGMDKNEINICIGLLKRKGAILIDKTPKGLAASITEIGTALAKKETIEEQLLKRISKEKIHPQDLNKVQQETIKDLIKRKQILKRNIERLKVLTLTKLGQELSKAKLDKMKVLERVTPELIKKGTWKTEKFRPYDVKINVPALTAAGKRHFVNQSIEYIKQVWLDMGFEEMSGDCVQTSYWNLDALYIPQDHPARTMQDTFFLGKTKPMFGDLPKDYKKIQDVHEHGAKTGSLGWQAKWSPEEAKKLLLRTHTTALSAQKVASLKDKDLPGKFFNVGKVFRNEALDWCHLFEFYQVDGIVVDPNANLKHLKGYLKAFFKKMGFTDIRMRPAHFPYTEPSVEVDVFHPVKKTWIELGGAGVFRPEVVIPLLGKDIPVLAWGLGLGRTMAEYFGLTDIRDFYRNDLKQMKEMKAWMRS